MVAMMVTMRSWGRLVARVSAWVVILVVLLIAVVFLPRALVTVDVGHSQVEQMTPAARAGAVNDIRSSFLQAIGGAALIAGAYITWRQLRHSMSDSREQRELQRQAHVTELFNSAVEHLGSSELQIRLGGIYALDRIGRDSAPDRDAIVNILAAYIRTQSPWPPPAPARFGNDYPIDQVPPLRVRAVDIQAALTTLARWGPTDAHDDIWPTADLTDADLRMGNLARAHLWRVRLHGANLAGANLCGADLRGVDLEYAVLEEADLQGAIADETTWWPANYDPENAGVQMIVAADARQ
jgi:hypothetical protein